MARVLFELQCRVCCAPCAPLPPSLSNHNKQLIIINTPNKKTKKNLDEIIRASDGIMVARGDLGAQIPVEEVPSVQKVRGGEREGERGG